MVRYIVVAPKFDTATCYSHECAREVVGFLKERGESYIFLGKEDAVRENVELVLKENPGAYYWFADHGKEDSLIGNDSRPVVDLDNVYLLARRDNYTIACLSGKLLGKEAKREGAKSYLGYAERVGFTTGKFWLGFKECFNSGFHIFYETSNYEETYRAMREKFTKWAIKAIDEGDYISAALFIHDRDCLVLYDLERSSSRSKDYCHESFRRKNWAMIPGRT